MLTVVADLVVGLKLPDWLNGMIGHQQFGCTCLDDVQQWLLPLRISVPDAVSMLDFCGKTSTILRAYDQFQGWSELRLGSGRAFEWPTEWKDILFWGCVLLLSSSESLTSKLYCRALFSRKDSPQVNIRSISGQYKVVVWLWIVKNMRWNKGLLQCSKGWLLGLLPEFGSLQEQWVRLQHLQTGV